MLSPSEQQDLEDLVEIANNLVPGIVKADSGQNILIFGEDVAQWPLFMIVMLRDKARWSTVNVKDATVPNKI